MCRTSKSIGAESRLVFTYSRGEGEAEALPFGMGLFAGRMKNSDLDSGGYTTCNYTKIM